MAPELAPLFAVLGVFGAWFGNRWGVLTVLVPIVLFWRSLVLMDDEGRPGPPGVEPDPYIEFHTAPWVAWLAVGCTLAGFAFGLRSRRSTARSTRTRGRR